MPPTPPSEPNTYTHDQWMSDFDWYCREVASLPAPPDLEALTAKFWQHFAERYPDDKQMERRLRFFRGISFLGMNLRAFEGRNIATVGRTGAKLSPILAMATWVHFGQVPIEQIDEDPDPALIFGYAESIKEGVDKQRPGWDERKA